MKRQTMAGTGRLPCEVDNGAKVNDAVYYPIHAGIVKLLHHKMRDVTTDVVSRSLYDEENDIHQRILMEIQDDVSRTLPSGGSLKIYLKGGLGTRLLLDQMLLEDDDNDPDAYKSNEYEVLQKVVGEIFKPSDLDSSVKYTGPNENDEDFLNGLFDEIVESCKRKRDEYASELEDLQEYAVQLCNDPEVTAAAIKICNTYFGFRKTAKSIRFSTSKKSDMLIGITDSDCPDTVGTTCTVVNSTGQENAVYVGDNRALRFMKGTTYHNFLLTRMKFSIECHCTWEDDTACVVDASSEFIDISFPMPSDTKGIAERALSANIYLTKLNNGLYVKSIKSAAYDVRQVVKEAFEGIEDAKLEKRVKRYMLLTSVYMGIHRLNEYGGFPRMVSKLLPEIEAVDDAMVEELEALVERVKNDKSLQIACFAAARLLGGKVTYGGALSRVDSSMYTAFASIALTLLMTVVAR